MKAREFEVYIAKLSRSEYRALVNERISRLNPEQQAIAIAREKRKEDQYELISKLMDEATNTPENNHLIADALRDHSDRCEHDRSIWKSCMECAKIDHIMFPELFDEDGENVE